MSFGQSVPIGLQSSNCRCEALGTIPGQRNLYFSWPKPHLPALEEEQEEDKEATGDPDLGPGHLLRDHLLDLRLHVSVHRFRCGAGAGGGGEQ